MRHLATACIALLPFDRQDVGFVCFLDAASKEWGRQIKGGRFRAHTLQHT